MDAATRRLNKEILAQYKDPNPALATLEPVDENNLLLWRAVLKGPPGTPYQGMLVFDTCFTRKTNC